MKTKVQITSVFGELLFEHEAYSNSTKETVEKAIGVNADLRYADLRYANLRSTDLSDADLRYADLRSANLRSADLSSANLRSANLRYADLRSANLRSADLSSANLRSANLRDANLSYANLSYANLSSADLRSADLSSADLRSADLSYANLRSADLSSANLHSADLSDADLSDADLNKIKYKYQIIPEEGSFIAWKKGRNNCVINLEIPKDAKRVCHLGGRKCRAEYVKVLDIFNKDGISINECFGIYDSTFKYIKGEIIKPNKYDPNPLIACSYGIHFYVTKQEAINN